MPYSLTFGEHYRGMFSRQKKVFYIKIFHQKMIPKGRNKNRKKLKKLTNLNNQKQWWAPIWTGLVIDQDAKHYHRMKKAVWLFLYLVLHANRRTGFLLRKATTMSSDMNVHKNTVFRWLHTLRKHGYITTESTGRCLHIQIKKWKGTTELPKVGLQKHQTCNLKNTKGDASPEANQMQNCLYCSPKRGNFDEPNDITIKKDILKNDNDNEIFQSNLHASKGLKTGNIHDQVAMDMATALNDRQNLPLYHSYSRKYPESLLRKVLSEVKQVPTEKIKKSRGALFNYLVQRYVQKSSRHLGS